MFDGRETLMPLNDEHTFPDNPVADLTHQAMEATLIHAQASVTPTPEQLAEIVKFEMGLSTAQVSVDGEGQLFTSGAYGGALDLQTQSYYPGMNDSLGSDPHDDFHHALAARIAALSDSLGRDCKNWDGRSRVNR